MIAKVLAVCFNVGWREDGVPPAITNLINEL
jgi:hypothetical protein